MKVSISREAREALSVVTLISGMVALLEALLSINPGQEASWAEIAHYCFWMGVGMGLAVATALLDPKKGGRGSRAKSP